jgi:hypothetical protein
MVEPLQRRLYLMKLVLGLVDSLLAVVQADFLVWLVSYARFVLVRSKILDLLAGVLDFCETERC